MVGSSQDDGVVETNSVIRAMGQMLSEVCILRCLKNRIVVIDTGN